MIQQQRVFSQKVHISLPSKGMTHMDYLYTFGVDPCKNRWLN